MEPLPLPAPPEEAPDPVADQPDAAMLITRIGDWARAWADQRAEDYLAFYASAFQPPDGLSRAAWEAWRRQRLEAPSFIEISLDEIKTRVVEPGRAVAEFQQSYHSDTFRDRVFKTQIWIEEGDSWKLVAERVAEPVETEPVETEPVETEPAKAANAVLTAPVPPAVPADAASKPLPELAAALPPGVATLLEGARLSVSRAPKYDPIYRIIAYPGGDPGWEKGSGVDLVVRAFRRLDVDLQQHIHEDILQASAAYTIVEPDPNIDHRRIRNLVVFLDRHGRELPIDHSADWQAGDLVFWSRNRSSVNHLGIVSDRRGASGLPLVIHHAEQNRPREEDVLFAWPVRAHYRWLPLSEPRH